MREGGKKVVRKRGGTKIGNKKREKEGKKERKRGREKKKLDRQ